MLADTDAGLDERVLALIAAAAGDGEPRLAVRAGQVLVPRLARAGQQDVLALPPGRDWRLEGQLNGGRWTAWRRSAPATRVVGWGLGRCGWRSARPG